VIFRMYFSYRIDNDIEYRKEARNSGPLTDPAFTNEAFQQVGKLWLHFTIIEVCKFSAVICHIS